MRKREDLEEGVVSEAVRKVQVGCEGAALDFCTKIRSRRLTPSSGG